MCGRSRCTLAPDQVIRTAGNASRWINQEQFQPSHNVSPGFATPVVRMSSEDSEPVVHTMRWGLVPSFTKKEDKPDHWRMFNARSESVGEKPAFRRLLPTRRCLVLLDGFYEWKKEKDGKQPYYIHLAADEPLVMAGLFDVWDGPEGPLYTYTILTTDSSKRLEWLHDRMPVILRDRAAQQLWLHNEDKGALGKALQVCGPYSGEDLVWHPVTRQMNSPAFQGPECSKELKKPSMHSFFKPKSSPAAAGKAAAATPGAAAATEAAAAKPEPAASAAVAAAVEGAEVVPKAAPGTPTKAAAAEVDVKFEPGAAVGEEWASRAAVKQEGADRQQQQQQQQHQAEGAAAGTGGAQQQQQRAGQPPADAAAAAAVNPDQRPSQPQRASEAAAKGEAAAAVQQQQRQPQASKQQQQQQKRKQSDAGASSKGTGGSAAKKARPAGQPDISRFFRTKGS